MREGGEGEREAGDKEKDENTSRRWRCRHPPSLPPSLPPRVRTCTLLALLFPTPLSVCACFPLVMGSWGGREGGREGEYEDNRQGGG